MYVIIFLTTGAGAVAITNAATVSSFGVAAGPVLVDQVRCAGNESRITDCYHNGVGNHNCFHSDDVGVSCQLRKLWMSVSQFAM